MVLRNDLEGVFCLAVLTAGAVEVALVVPSQTDNSGCVNVISGNRAPQTDGCDLVDGEDGGGVVGRNFFTSPALHIALGLFHFFGGERCGLDGNLGSLFVHMGTEFLQIQHENAQTLLLGIVAASGAIASAFHVENVVDLVHGHAVCGGGIVVNSANDTQTLGFLAVLEVITDQELRCGIVIEIVTDGLLGHTVEGIPQNTVFINGDLIQTHASNVEITGVVKGAAFAGGGNGEGVAVEDKEGLTAVGGEQEPVIVDVDGVAHIPIPGVVGI